MAETLAVKVRVYPDNSQSAKDSFQKDVQKLSKGLAVDVKINPVLQNGSSFEDAIKNLISNKDQKVNVDINLDTIKGGENALLDLAIALELVEKQAEKTNAQLKGISEKKSQLDSLQKNITKTSKSQSSADRAIFKAEEEAAAAKKAVAKAKEAEAKARKAEAQARKAEAEASKAEFDYTQKQLDAARKEREREEKQRDAANKKQEKQNKQKIQQQNQLLSLQKKFLKIEQRIEGTGFAGSEYDSGKYLNQLYKDFGHYGEGGTFKLDDTADIEKREQALRSLADTIRQLEIELTKYTISQKKDALEAKETKKAVEDKISSFKKMLSAYKSFGRSDIKNKFKELADKIRAADKVTDELQKEFDDLKKECQELDKTVVSLGNDIASQLVSRLKQAATTAVFALFSNAIHMAAENIQLFDNELTQMQIITHESDGAIRDMAEEILSASKRIAASAPDITNAATVFARLGYSGDESVKLAEMATQFSRIADVDIAAAEENLTSIIKAFDININEVESVLDKLVVVGNRFPISAAGIGEGMQNAASALNAAGNTLEESVAMLMAANTTAQDPSRSSTAMRTIAARIRSANGATSEAAITELEELGEDVEGLDQAVLVYQKHLDQYTGGIVQLLDKENGELRSTYDVLNDLAGVWDKLGSQAKAVITKDLAGVRQQDVFSGLMANWDSVNKAISAQADSTGELQKASSIWVDSLQGRLERLKATFQSIAEHLIDNEAIKLTISLLTVVLDIIDRLLSISPELNSALVAFGVSVVGINKVLPTLSTTVKNVADAFNLFTGAAGAAKVEAVGTSGAFSKLVTALGGMPGVIVGVVAAVASAAFAIKAHMDEVHQAVLDNTENASLGYTNIAQAYNAIENASNVGEIVEVLDQIGVKYDDELKSIKDINVARQIGVDLAKQELKLKAAEFVYDNDNEKAYNRSKKVLENDGSFLNATSVVNPFTGGVQYFTGTIDQKILDIESAIEGLEFRYDSLTETEKDYLKNLQETLDPLRTQRDECLVVVDTYEMMKGVLEDVDSALESSSDEYANVSNATNDLTVDVKSAAEAFAEFNDKIDSIQSAYGSLVGAAEQYNKYQALDIDTLQTVLSLEDKYLAALSIQGDQAMVNADIFQTMVDVEMAAAKQKAIDQAYTELLAIAQEQYTESAVEAADETNVLLWELTNLTTGYQNAAYASLTLAQAQSLQEAGIASFSGEKLQKAQQVVAALDARLGLIDRTAETAKSSFKGLNNVMGGYEDAAKDAKSATEKLKQSLEEEVEALEKVGDELDKEANKLKLWGEAMVDALEDRKDALEKEKETLEENLSKEEEYLKLYGDAAGDVINNRINLLNDQKEALEELYEEEDKEYQLMKARQALDEAMANKTVRVYTRDEGWTWQADPTAVKAAQENLYSIEQERSREDAIQSLQDEIDKLQELADKYQESSSLIGTNIDDHNKKLEITADLSDKTYDELVADADSFGQAVSDNMASADRETIEKIDSQIESIDGLIEKYQDAMGLIGMSAEEYQAMLAAQAEVGKMSFGDMGNALGGYTEKIIENMNAVYENERALSVLKERIESLSGSSTGGSGGDESSPLASGNPNQKAHGTLVAQSTDASNGALGAVVQNFSVLITQLGQTKLSALDAADGMNRLQVAQQFSTNGILSMNDVLGWMNEALGTSYTMSDLLSGKLSEYVSVEAGAIQKSIEVTETAIEQSEANSGVSDTVTQLTEDQSALTNENATQQESWTELTTEAQEDSALICGYMTDIVTASSKMRSGVSGEFINAQTNIQEQSGLINSYLDTVVGRFKSVETAANNASAAMREAISLQGSISSGAVGGIVKDGHIPGLASGTQGARANAYFTQEQGNELLIRSYGGAQGRYTYLSDGDGVLPADLTRTIFAMSESPILKALMHNSNLMRSVVPIGNSGGAVISIGDIHLSGVNNVDEFSNEIVRKLPGSILQKLGKM